MRNIITMCLIINCFIAYGSDTTKVKLSNMVKEETIIKNLISTFENKDFIYCNTSLDTIISIVIFNGESNIEYHVKSDSASSVLNVILKKISYVQIRINIGSSDQYHGYIISLTDDNNIQYVIYVIVDNVKIKAVIFK